MKLDLKRDALLIIPESDADRAYIEDTLGLDANGAHAVLTRVCDVALGYAKADLYVLKTTSPTNP